MDIERVKEMIGRGMSHGEIAEELSSTRIAVASFCSKHRILKRTASKQHPAYVEEIRRMVEDEGMQHQKVAELLGLDRSTVGKWCKWHGIVTMGPGPRPGENHPGWKGGVRMKGSYRYIYKPDHPNATKAGDVAEHRLVMEEKIGRYLLPQEVVHHLNGNPVDNRPENLALYSSNGDHLKEDLKGRVPNWSEDGKRRIRKAASEADHSYLQDRRVPFDVDKFLRLVAEDKLIQSEIAEEMGVSKDTLRRRCKELGISLNWKSKRSRLKNSRAKVDEKILQTLRELAKDESLLLGDIAKIVCLNRTYLSRLYRKMGIQVNWNSRARKLRPSTRQSSATYAQENIPSTVHQP